MLIVQIHTDHLVGFAPVRINVNHYLHNGFFKTKGEWCHNWWSKGPRFTDSWINLSRQTYRFDVWVVTDHRERPWVDVRKFCWSPPWIFFLQAPRFPLGTNRKIDAPQLQQLPLYGFGCPETLGSERLCSYCWPYYFPGSWRDHSWMLHFVILAPVFSRIRRGPTH